MEKSENFNVSKAVKDYSSSVEELEKITTEITKTASDGLPISEELRSKLNKELDGLKTHYTNLCEKAHKISKDIPENPSIYDLQKIIEEYDKISSELSEIKEILTKFIRVTSNDNEYKEALRPFQNKAREIIEKINNKTADKKIVSSEICKGAGCFIEALNVPSYKNINKETRHSLQNIFDTTVISGLAAGEYFDPQISTENEQSKPAQEPDAEPEQAQTEEPNAIDETPEDNTTAEETNENSDNSENQQNQNTIEHKAREMNLNGQLSMPESHIFELITPSVENFLMILSYIQIITPRQALGFCKNSRRFTSEKLNLRDMKKWFGEWSKKGFLSTITLPTENEKVFCLPTNPLIGKTITPEIEKKIISELNRINSHFNLFEKTKPVSVPKPTEPEAKPTSAPEQPKQAEPAQAEPIKQEEEIPTQQDATEPEKQTEPAEQTESEIPVSESSQPEDNEDRIEEEIIEEENTIEDSQNEEEIPNDDPATPETEPEQTENNDDALTTICNLIKSNKIYCATAYAKATKNPFYDVLAYAVDDPMAECSYSSDDIQKIQELNGIEDERDFIEPLIVSAAMRAFFSARNTYDYTLQSLHDTIQGFEIVDSNTNLKNAIYDIFKFKKDNGNGLDVFVNQDNGQYDKFEKLKKEAEEKIIVAKNINTENNKRFKETKEQMFDRGDIIKFLESIKSDPKNKKFYAQISTFVSNEFIKENSKISRDNIEDSKIREYIDKFWRQAGKIIKSKLNDPIQGERSSTIFKKTRGCVDTLVDWINLIDETPNGKSDTGTNEYNRSKKTFISSLKAAKKETNKSINQYENHIKKQAGLKIVEHTIEEIQNCIEKKCSIEDSKKYFYVDFLQTHHILLDENYIPDLMSFPSDPVSLLPENRILKHADKVQNSSFEQFAERLDYILKNTGQNRGDDYGSAELILEYLKNTNHAPEDIDSIEKSITDGKNRAKDCTKEKKDNFVGELELSFAYGQLDNSSEDEILTNVNNWYNYSLDSFNYGFFFYVVDSYIEDIKVKAKHREKELLEDLEEFKKRKNDGISVEERQKIENKIKECIQDQNYTVAEDWLGNPEKILKDEKNVSDEDFLGNFVNNYSMYYTPIANMEKVFWVLVKPYIEKRNDAAEIMKMTQSWFSSYIDNNIGKEKLETLLNSLGFDEIVFEKDLAPIKVGSESYENYTIKSKKHSIFLHPIAALGSEMMREEIRIVCIKQQKDANQIMNIIEKIGKNNQHTLILLDCALSLSDRRILAKRSKDDLGNYLFAVIDRTVMMFMAMNYDNTKMNRMLMALIMPFTYYQPYVYSSVEDLPPEMFIGRKIELEKIEAVKGGVNIVYGGRQLGKTALLKRAEWDINKNNDNKKAVYISINTCDCEKAAETILTELGKKKILDSDRIKKIREDKQKILGSETKLDDWDILKDAIGDRLNNNLPYKISYLLLLLDEADDFIKACDNVKFKPFLALEELQKNSKGQFKFVIAGLRDLVKFKEIVDTGNCPISHVDSLKVTPFNISEARELLEIPLHYLGLRFSKDKEGLKLLYLILANTNYFPGLIQMYCAIMLEIMHNKNENNSIGYNETDNPPYEITKDHVKKALYELNKKDEEGKDIIWKKLEITLNLGDDDYYHIIALVLASLHHEKNNKKGYSPKDIKDYCKALDIKKIAGMEIQKLKILLDELKELNILKNTSDRNHYLFTRFNFFQKLGTKEEVEDKLLAKYMEDKNENPENMVGTNTQS